MTDTYTVDCGGMLREMGVEITLPKGAVLRRSLVYFLLDGYCALMAMTEGGEAYSFLYFRPGMLLNFTPAVAQTDKLHAVTRKRFSILTHVIMTKTPCKLLAMNGVEFAHKLETSLPLTHLLSRSLMENWINLLALSLDISSRTATARVCRLILDNTPDDPESCIPSFLTYTEIASHLSLHIITVTKIFRALRQSGLLHKERRAHVLADRQRMHLLAEMEEELLY